MSKFSIFAVLFFLICFFSKGQDVQYSQFYANPFYLNPAFAGSTDESRVGFNFRNQWPALDQSFLASTAYGDHYFENLNSGVGVIITGAKESFTQSQWYEVGLLYSYRLKLSESTFFQIGFQGSFTGRDVYFDRVILGTQLDINRGVIIGQPGDGFEGESKLRSFDAHTGFLFYGKKFWMGGSAFHLLEPSISFLSESENTLPIRFGVHGGYRFELAPGYINEYLNNYDQERSMDIAFNYRQQGLYNQLDIGAEFFFEPLILGLWYRGLPTKYQLPNSESLIALIGIALDSGIELGYSFDFSVSKLGQSVSGGAHELSFRYVFTSNKKRKNSYPALPSFRF